MLDLGKNNPLNPPFLRGNCCVVFFKGELWKLFPLKKGGLRGLFLHDKLLDING